ncbi:MAG: ATPase domain-containing protein [Candidatus Altiarchaeota archaeon]
MAIKRIKTGIEGLDAMVDGGLEKGTQVLVIGEVGAGKTIFGLHYLYGGALRGEAGLLVTFEEPGDSLLETMKSFNWRAEEFIEEKKLNILQIKLSELTHEVESGFDMIKQCIAELKPKRLVIDSVGSINSLFPGLPDRKAAMHKLTDTVRESGCTTLLLSQPEEGQNAHQRHGGLEIIVDGIIGLNYILSSGDTRFRSLEVLKMRRTHHHNKRVWFEIKNGIYVDYEEGGSIIWLRKK